MVTACGGVRKDTTEQEAVAAATLVGSLQTLQSAARQEHAPEHQHLLEGYHVGQRLDRSRPVLETLSQNIIDRASQERPPGVDTAVLERVTAERAAFVAAGSLQEAELSKGKQVRALRDALTKSIVARRKKIQYAADAQRPANQRGTSKRGRTSSWRRTGRIVTEGAGSCVGRRRGASASLSFAVRSRWRAYASCVLFSASRRRPCPGPERAPLLRSPRRPRQQSHRLI